jgi:hypothetical protein
MATYPEIDRYVRRTAGFSVKPCWIADVKELNGLPVRRAWNRARHERQVPCPPDKRPAIERAFQHFGII